MNQLSSEHGDLLRPRNHLQQMTDDNPSSWPRHQWNNINSDDLATTKRRHVPDGPSNIDRGGAAKLNSLAPGDFSPRGRRLDGRHPVDDIEEDLNSEERDELSALRSNAVAPAGRMPPFSARLARPASHHHPGPDSVTMATTTMTSSSTSVPQPSRRLTLPSIVKYSDSGGSGGNITASAAMSTPSTPDANANFSFI